MISDILKNNMKKEIEELINYAYKNGFIGDEVFEWTEKQKQDYYDKCCIYEPEILEE